MGYKALDAPNTGGAKLLFFCLPSVAKATAPKSTGDRIPQTLWVATLRIYTLNIKASNNVQSRLKIIHDFLRYVEILIPRNVNGDA